MNQVWPLDDTFTDGATAYGTGVRRYLRVKPWATTLTDYNLVPAPEGGEPRLPKYQFFGYQFSGPSFGAAFMPFGASSAGNDISAFVERETYIADGEVMILPALYEQSGVLDYEAFHCVGVWAGCLAARSRRLAVRRRSLSTTRCPKATTSCM